MMEVLLEIPWVKAFMLDFCGKLCLNSVALLLLVAFNVLLIVSKICSSFWTLHLICEGNISGLMTSMCESQHVHSVSTFGIAVRRGMP